MKPMLYILKTRTDAMFDNMEDATSYYRNLKSDEPDGDVREPRRDPNEGLYVVTLTKSEDVQASRR
jgi:hypothetical protein